MQKPLLGGPRRAGSPAYSATRLYAQGAVLVALGFIEVLAAVGVGHPLGVGAGVAAVAGGLLLLGYGATQQEVGAGAGGATPPRLLPHQAPPPSLPRAAMHVANAVGALALALLLVRAASPDPPATGAFPEACVKLQGCARVALAHPHRDGGEKPLRLRTTLDAASAAALEWIAEQPRTTLLEDVGAGGGRTRLLHARLLSFLWGFADDFWVRVSCAGGGDGRAVVEAMGTLRLGVGDMGVNPARNADFFAGLRRVAAAKKLPRGTCEGADGVGGANASGGAQVAAADD